MADLCLLHIAWLVIILASTFFEAFTEKSVAIWCAPAAAFALIAAIFGTSTGLQVVVFTVSAAVMIFTAQFIKRIIRKSGE